MQTHCPTFLPEDRFIEMFLNHGRQIRQRVFFEKDDANKALHSIFRQGKSLSIDRLLPHSFILQCHFTPGGVKLAFLTPQPCHHSSVVCLLSSHLELCKNCCFWSPRRGNQKMSAGCFCWLPVQKGDVCPHTKSRGRSNPLGQPDLSPWNIRPTQ